MSQLSLIFQGKLSCKHLISSAILIITPGGCQLWNFWYEASFDFLTNPFNNLLINRFSWRIKGPKKTKKNAKFKFRFSMKFSLDFQCDLIFLHCMNQHHTLNLVKIENSRKVEIVWNFHIYENFKMTDKGYYFSPTFPRVSGLGL